LEKEGRDSQRKLFEVQRERDEASSQLRKLDAERNELRKRVNEVCFPVVVIMCYNKVNVDPAVNVL
jgi:flagellar biosynthesis chaperone FliJ